MIVKEIINEKVMTLSEAKEILTALKRSGEGEKTEEWVEEEEEEVRYERRKALKHTTKFAKLKARESRALINELLGLAKMKEEIAVRIADLMPKSPNEVRAIYAKERFTLTEADLEKILDLVAKYE